MEDEAPKKAVRKRGEGVRPSAACIRCKLLKVRCVKTASSQDCVRCAQAGERCFPAAPSQQGKRNAKRRLPREPDYDTSRAFLAAAPQLATPLVIPTAVTRGPLPLEPVVSSLLSEWSLEPGEGAEIVRGMFASPKEPPSRGGTYFLLRTLAVRAAQLHSNALFQRVLCLASAYGIPFAEVVHQIEGELLAIAESARVPIYPDHLLSKLKAHNDSGEYLLMRRVHLLPDGDLTVWVNEAFEASVCSLAQVWARCRRASARERIRWGGGRGGERGRRDGGGETGEERRG